MAEIRNNFIKSKMNRDLDARLVPPGEYREAQNVAISKSEGDDVGALENVLGNLSLEDFGLSLEKSIDVIGHYMDLENDNIYVFMTNYVDTSSDQLSNFASSQSDCYIGVYNVNSPAANLIVSGYFLNFSKTHPILGVNLINNQLFWTDNRNQPRQINVAQAAADPTYYSTEDTISIVKYYPYKPIDLYRSQVVTVVVDTAGTGYTAPTYGLETSGGSGSDLTVNIDTVGGLGNVTAVSIDNIGQGYVDGEVLNVIVRSGVGSGLKVEISVEYVSTMFDTTNSTLPDGSSNNPWYNGNWPGDPDFLTDKFVRFAYRFKFDNQERSLISPFTQECFVPTQDGYFIGDDEKKSYKSTEVGFMENKVNEIILVLNTPDDTTTWSNIQDDLKVSEIEIIYKQSNQQQIKVLDTIPASEFGLVAFPQFYYTYQSRKPWKTLPAADLLRVYDQAPVRALAQEIVGNRIVYGNYIDKPTPPEALNYQVSVGVKLPEVVATLTAAGTGYGPATGVATTGGTGTGLEVNIGATAGAVVSFVVSDPGSGYVAGDVLTITGGGANAQITLSSATASGYTRKEYQNHTLKQNRSYQVGIILCDRYGRQSDVILSTVDTSSVSDLLKGSTIFHKYKTGTNAKTQITDFSYYPGGADDLFSAVDTWPGDSLQLTFNEIINSVRSSITGEPGLYRTYGEVETLDITTPGTGYTGATGVATTGGSGTGLTINTTDTAGAITAVVINNVGSGYKIGDVVTISGGGGDAEVTVRSTYNANPLGWYSYKIVVKQSEVEYYNIYFPGVLNGYIDGESRAPLAASTSEPIVHLALHADNINKVPRDLSQVGPVQTIFKTGRPSFHDDPDYYTFIDDTGLPYMVDPYSASGEAQLKSRDRARDLDSGSQLTNASVELHPRVINYSRGGAGDNNAQWYPSENKDLAVTIGTGTELGLWDPSEAMPFNTAPVFYGYQSNPYIAKVEANPPTPANITGFGVTGPSPAAGKWNFKCQNFDPVGSGYIAGTRNAPITMPTGTGYGVNVLVDIWSVSAGRPTSMSISSEGSGWNLTGAGPETLACTLSGAGDGLFTFEIEITKTAYGTAANMTPIFAVYETDPIDSKLNIYWETTTSGLISELNTNIQANDTTTPYDLKLAGGGPVVFTLNESNASGTACTDYFHTVNASGVATPNPTDATASMTLLSVYDKEGNNRRNDFVLTTAGGGTYRIESANTFYYGESHVTKENYTFRINAVVPSATYATDGIRVSNILNLGADTRFALANAVPTITPTAIGGNVTPGIPACSGAVSVSGTSTSDQHVITFTGTNGSADTTRNEDGLTFEISSQPANDYYLQPVPSRGAQTQLYIYGGQTETVLSAVTVKITDAGGATATCTVNITANA